VRSVHRHEFFMGVFAENSGKPWTADCIRVSKGGHMSRILMLALALLCSTAWLQAQDQYPQSPPSGSSQTGSAAAEQTSVEPATKNSTNPNPELVGALTKQLNVTPQQATGGAGAIFGLAKSRLNPGDFSKVAAAVPGMDGFLKAAPSGGAGSMLGSIASQAGGGMGGLASLAGSFQSLGLSPSMAGKFVPVLKNYIGGKGGSSVASLFAGALK
jgi:hypothetical protein